MSQDVMQHGMQLLPVLPLRDVVIFPYTVIPLFVGRAKSIQAVELGMAEGKQVLLLAQRSATQDEPASADLYSVGTVATILQLLKLPDGTLKVLVEGKFRAQVEQITDKDGCMVAEVNYLDSQESDSTELKAMQRALLDQFEQYIKLTKKIPKEVLDSLINLEKPDQVADTVAAHMILKVDKKQQILSINDTQERFIFLLNQLENEIDILQIEKRIRGRVKRQMEKSQREYYLNEQVKAIQKELGEGEDGNDFDELEKQIRLSGMSKEALAKANGELKKLKMMSPMSAEATVVRNYIDSVLELPWKKKTKINKDLQNAEKILDEDHYGLEEVKKRILEYLAVQLRVNNKMKAPILCLIGPPGVGKTSLGQSIARATNRKFVRMALGGVRDESEIRGHRRTYIGSMPGKILQNLSKIKVKNPLFLFDEIDKMGADFRGDPSSALLEVLDPEQNHAFVDHYIEVEFDLSEIMFVATANSMNIPVPLLDRMEVIRLSGYTEDEKVNIALKYLISKQFNANGILDGELEVQETAIRDIIRYYTREAGVRGLDKEIAKICRKVVAAHSLDEKKNRKISVNAKNLDQYLGVRKFDFGVAKEENRIGLVTGLAWTEVGGELLTVEAATFPGKGNVIRTGNLGEVMQESIVAAMSVVRSRAKLLGLDPAFYDKQDMHLHVPEGATPKDGPSAGSAMVTAIVSALTSIPVKADVAMTGEITLRGEVLPIGGLKEKLLAAQRGGIQHVLIPHDNLKDLEELPASIIKRITIHPIKWIDEVLTLALERQPEIWIEADAGEKTGAENYIAGDSSVKNLGTIAH